MTLHLGNIDAGSTIYIPFHTFDSNGASITLTGLATSDILIYKNGSITQRSSTAGYTLLDTDGIDFDGLTGIHGFSIDLSDNTDAGFYAAGNVYWVVVSSVTVDTRTVSFVAASFRLGPAAVNVTQLLGTAWLTPGTAGTPDVNAKLAGGTAWGSGAITAASIAADAITAAKIADGAIDAATFAASAINAAAIAADAITAAKIADGAIDAATFAAGAINAAAIAADAITDAKVAADVTIASVTGAVGSVTGAVGSVTGLTAATVHADLDDIQARLPAALTVDGNIKADTLRVGGTLQTAGDIMADTNDIQARLPAALVSGRMDASVGAMAANTLTASALASDAIAEIRSIASGTSDSGTTTTMVDAARTEADTDYFKGDLILFTSGTIAGQCRLITAFDPATDTITYAPATTQAAGTQTYEILPAGRADVQLWLGSVVNALVSGRVDASAGAIANDAITAAAIAADAIGSSELAASAVTEIQTGLSTVTTAQVKAEVVAALTVDLLADSVAVDGTRPTMAQAIYEMIQFLTEKSVSGTTVTVKKVDGSTSLMTFTLDSATDPTSITRAT